MAGDRDIVGPIPPGADPDAFDRSRRRLLWALPTGLYVLSLVGESGDPQIMTISMVTQIATEPKTIVLGIEQASFTRGIFERARCLALVLVSSADAVVARKFARPGPTSIVTDVDGMSANGVEVDLDADTGLVVPRCALGFLVLEPRQTVDFVSHVAVFAQVIGAIERHRIGPDDRSLSMLDTRMNYGG
ncbi:MAG: flavin reductase [Ferrimicrobium sp.]